MSAGNVRGSRTWFGGHLELHKDGGQNGHHHGGGGCVGDPHGQEPRGQHQAQHYPARTDEQVTIDMNTLTIALLL